MSSSALSPLSPGSRRRAARDSKRSESPPAGLHSLADAGAEPAAVVYEEEVARLTAADLSELLNLALEQTIALSAMEGGVILLLDEKRQRLTLATERNLPPGARESLGKEQISVGELIPGVTVQHCQLLVVENSKDDEREVPAFREAGISTHVCIPVAFGSRALGVLSLVSRQPCAFSQSRLDLFATVGQQIGMAMERARLSGKRAMVAERIKLLDELTRVAVSSLNVAEIFDRVSEQVNKLVEHDRLSIDLRPHGEDYCETYAIAGEDPPKGTRFPLQESPAGEVSLTGRPILRTNWLEEAVYSSELVVAREHGLCSAMFVPLQTRGRVIGTLSLASRQPARYAEPELRIAQEIADHLAVIVEHSLLHEESKELAVVQERTRLAHELHDALAQSFISIILELDLAERMMRTDLVAGRHKLARTRELAQEGLEETRRAILALRPAALEACSLSEAVARELEILASEGIAVKTSRSGTVVPVAEKVETAIYGIARAALANIRRHAKATKVDAVLDYGREALTLTIADNGVGFDIPSSEVSGGGGGFGLRSMRERARAADGDVQVASTPGRGTCVTARMPYVWGAEPRSEPQPKARAQHEGHPPLRVLLADDHVVARRGTCRMLEEAPEIEVVAEARDGIEALAKARAFRPDVLIADIRMPGMGGIELVSALRDEGLPTRAIILTAFLEDGLISEAMRAGAQGYVLKDVGGPELISAVRAVHRGETFLQPAVASELGRQVRDTGNQGLAGTLTSQERKVLSLVARGLRNKEIARELGLSEATVKFHVTHIFEKLGVSGRTEALGKAVELGIVSFP